MALGRGLSSLIPSFRSADNSVKTIKKGEEKISAEEKIGRLWQIPLSSLRPNPYQPRRDFSHQDLEELIESIKEHGLLQPLLVSETADGNYELIAGERRWRSMEVLGWPTAPAIIRPVKDGEKLELALIENIQRKNLNPIEEAFAYERLVDEFGLTHEEISKKVGKSRPYVSNLLRLLTLPAEIQKGLIDGVITSTFGRALLGLASVKEQLKIFHQSINEKKATTIAVTEQAAEDKLRLTGETRREAQIIDYERKLREALGTKVRITKRGEKGSLKIDYYSTEELLRIVKAILR